MSPELEKEVVSLIKILTILLKIMIVISISAVALTVITNVVAAIRGLL